MQVGDLVRLGTAETQQFRVIEVDDEGGARVEPTTDAPNGYAFRMRQIDLTAWTE
ncbi:hypothetical protein AB0L62_07930 [Nocardia asteroides]|uniref:hypothetical protein n=1 Tax=Nocardia asteroides TaxID=1824 RepID=UPI003446997C